MTAKIYVVTGVAGFIGSHIAERLLRDGAIVRGIDNMLTGRQQNIDYLRGLGGDFQFYPVSIGDISSLIDIFTGVDVVFHEAALPSVPRSVENPRETHEHCVTGTLNVLEAARMSGVRRVIYAASSSAYGDITGDTKGEHMPPAPISPYGAAKLAGEYYCRVYHHTYGLETVCLRYFNVFGARQDPTSQYAAVIPLFITTMLDGGRPQIFGDGQQTRDFTYIDNVVHGNLLAATAPQASGEVVNLATGNQVSLLQLVDKLNYILGTDYTPLFLPPRTGDILHSQANIDKARQLLGYEPIISFDEGLARTVRWYQNGD